MEPHWKTKIAEIRTRHPLRNTHKEVAAGLSPAEKVASWITDHVGTMGFFSAVLLWTAIWLGWNLLAPAQMRFDPPVGFVFWLFISNMIQLFLMPLIMLGQNIHGRCSEARAEHDLDVNVKAEQEIEVILHHLERQNDMLIAIIAKQGITLEEILGGREPLHAAATSAGPATG